LSCRKHPTSGSSANHRTTIRIEPEAKISTDPVSSCVVDHFVHGFPLKDLVRNLFRCLERLAQQRYITGISHIQGAAIDDEIVEGFQLGIPESPGRFGQNSCQVLQKMEYLTRADVIQKSLGMNCIEPVKQHGVTLDGPSFMVRLEIIFE
jgi:hypothetical protein